MCIMAFAWLAGKHKLVVAANRDEFYRRPTKAAAFWDDNQTLGGVDLEHGGSWLLIDRRGRFAALTNYRDPALLKDGAPSRGSIVRNYVKGNQPPRVFYENHLAQTNRYNGFNLLMLDRDRLCYYSNVSATFTELRPGVYGLSNHLLDTPWPKTLRIKAGLQQLIDNQTVSHTALLDLLADNMQAADAALPNTGITEALEKSLSSIFISLDDYGTRCSTALTISERDQVAFTEVTYDSSGYEAGRNQFEFNLNHFGR
jgi:uncharacterized protein with NRDE domain